MHNRTTTLLGVTVGLFLGIVAPAAVLVVTAFAPTFANETFGTPLILLAGVLFVGTSLAIVVFGDRLRDHLAETVTPSSA